jgi:hypothetical protein
LLTRLCEYQLPSIRGIRIFRQSSSGSPVDKEINHFLTHSFPLEINQFYLYKCGDSDEHDKLGDYLDSLIAIPVTELIGISKFMISKHQLKKIMQAHSNSEHMSFPFCSWGAFEDTFSISNSITFNTKRLDFTRSKNMSNENVENLAKGLSNNQSLKEKLEEVWINNCGLEVEKVQEIFEKHGFENVKVKDD